MSKEINKQKYRARKKKTGVCVTECWGEGHLKYRKVTNELGPE